MRANHLTLGVILRWLQGFWPAKQRPDGIEFCSPPSPFVFGSLEGILDKQKHKWLFGDLNTIDEQHCWSIFTMYWPVLASLALIGNEQIEKGDLKPWAPVVRDPQKEGFVSLGVDFGIHDGRMVLKVAP